MSRTGSAIAYPVHSASPFIVANDLITRAKSSNPFGCVLSGHKMKIIKISKSSETQKRPSSKKTNSKSVNHLNLETTAAPQFTSIMIPASTKSKASLLNTRKQDYISRQQQQQQFRVNRNMLELNLPQANRVNSARVVVPNSQRSDLASTSTPPNRFLDEISVHGKRPSVSNLQLPMAATVINRSNEERSLFPDKLILERKNLTCCPVVEGETSFKLINYQHNQIKSISNLDQMRNLIFLDLYNNHIEKITGLGSLVQLRVLMLGKNRISKIENLNSLVFLDILDLHANQITRIENLRSLHELRVLNLAANRIKTIENLNGLESLIELNLRRNEITDGKDLNFCPKLQRLYLSYNDIKSLTSLRTLETVANLQELSIDNNPVCALELPTYKRDLLALLPGLRKLDMKRVTEEEKRVAERAWARELSKRREMDEAALIEERKRLVMRDAENEWMSQTTAEEKIKIVSLGGNASPPASYNPTSVVISSSSSSSIVSRSSNNERETTINLDESGYPDPSRSSSAGNTRSSCKNPPSESVKSQANKKLTSLNGGANILEDNVMSFFGNKSIEILDHKLDPFIINQSLVISFNYIDYDDVLVKFFAKIRTKFPSVVGLIFTCCNVKCLNQLDALVEWKRLDSVAINKKDNPITEISFWRQYLIHRLGVLQLKKINDQLIGPDEVSAAEKLFLPVRNLASCVPEYRLLTILGPDRKKIVKQARDLGQQHVGETNQAREIISKAVFQDHLKSVKSHKLVRSHSLDEYRPKSNNHGSKLLKSVLTQVANNDLKLRKIDQIKDHMWAQFLQSCLASCSDKEAYVNSLCKKFQIFF